MAIWWDIHHQQKKLENSSSFRVGRHEDFENTPFERLKILRNSPPVAVIGYILSS